MNPPQQSLKERIGEHLAEDLTGEARRSDVHRGDVVTSPNGVKLLDNSEPNPKKDITRKSSPGEVFVVGGIGPGSYMELEDEGGKTWLAPIDTKLVTAVRQNRTHQVVDESIEITIVGELVENVLLEGHLFEFLNYNQLVAATHDFWRSRFNNAKQVDIPQPDLVVLKSGDMDITFGCRARSPGSGRLHYCGMTVYPDDTTKKLTVARLKEWWGSLKARINKFLGRKVPEKILTGAELRMMKCKVTCDCEDFLYRFEVANKAKGAADIKHSNGARPNIRNPEMHPGICKHLLSLLRYLTDDATIQAKEAPKK